MTVHTMAETSRRSRVKILLVDDHAGESGLARSGAGGPGPGTGAGATPARKRCAICWIDDFAAILLDVKMPEMDGFQTAELIRARKRSRHTPILFLTGYKSDEHLFRGYDLGAVDFLFKPIVAEILRSKVGVFVELSRNTALLRAPGRGSGQGGAEIPLAAGSGPRRHDHQ